MNVTSEEYLRAMNIGREAGTEAALAAMKVVVDKFPLLPVKSAYDIVKESMERSGYKLPITMAEFNAHEKRMQS